jgi:hypothetical protein
MKLLVLITLFLWSLKILCQNRAIGMIYAPTDNGIGLRYDKQINEMDVYGSACWGSYWFRNGERIHNHVKFSAGVVKYVTNRKEKVINLFSLGVSYHTYGEMSAEYVPVPDHLFFPVSLDIGVGYTINHFNIGWCYDPFKKEVVVNSGYYF